MVWTNLRNAQVKGASLVKVGSYNGAWDGGGVSQQQLAMGQASMQFKVLETSKFRFIGLTHSPDWAGSDDGSEKGPEQMTYSFRLQGNPADDYGKADIYENNQIVKKVYVQKGDVLGITISGTLPPFAQYTKNGSVIWRSAKVPTYPMFVDALLIDSGAQVDNVELTASCTGPFFKGHWPPGCWRPFSDSSPFNTPLPANPKPAWNSTEILKRVKGDFSTSKQVGNMSARLDGTSGWPTYYANSTDGRFQLDCDTYPCSIERDAEKIHIPAGAVVQGGSSAPAWTDRHLTVVDQANGYEYGIWQYHRWAPVPQIPAGEWWGLTVGSAGKTALNGNGLNGNLGQGTAARFANLAGRIRAEEFSAGEINHALTITFRCSNGQYVYPATGNGLRCDDKEASLSVLPAQVNRDITNAPPMGARLQLKMAWSEIDGLHIPTWKKIILRAMSKYGMFFNDTGTNNYFGIQVESGLQYTAFRDSHGNPYPDRWLTDVADKFGWGTFEGSRVGTWRANDDGIDWDAKVWSKLVVLDECVTKRTCITP